jgi:hypothetical protein
MDSVTGFRLFDYDRENLNLVLNNLQPKNRIDFELVSDNLVAADYKKLPRTLISWKNFLKMISKY